MMALSVSKSCAPPNSVAGIDLDRACMQAETVAVDKARMKVLDTHK
jgi:hypothetical protein